MNFHYINNGYIFGKHSIHKLSMTPLTEATFGQTVRIVKVGGDLKERQHLADLGCTLNAEVTVVNTQDGDLVLKIKDSRVAVGEALAKEIFF